MFLSSPVAGFHPAPVSSHPKQPKFQGNLRQSYPNVGDTVELRSKPVSSHPQQLKFRGNLRESYPEVGSTLTGDDTVQVDWDADYYANHHQEGDPVGPFWVVGDRLDEDGNRVLDVRTPDGDETTGNADDFDVQDPDQPTGSDSNYEEIQPTPPQSPVTSEAGDDDDSN